MNIVQWGILSTANIAETQLIPAIERSKNAKVVAIASRNKAVFTIAEKFHIETVYESYEELLSDPHIDVVYIPLPNHLHKEWIMKAALAGKHILCEKPITLTADEAKDVVRVCHENKGFLMEAFMYQFHPQHDRVREIIASGEIGEVKLMRASFSFYMEESERKRNIRMNPEKGGGSIYDVGSYCIHSIRNILQTEPKDVRVFADIDPVYQIDTSASAVLKMENGTAAMFDCSFDMTFRNEYEIIGTKGTIQVPRAYRPDIQGGEGVIIIEKRGEKRIETIVADQYALEVEHLSAAVLEGTQNYSLEDMIQNMKVIDACYLSIRECSKVTL